VIILELFTGKELFPGGSESETLDLIERHPHLQHLQRSETRLDPMATTTAYAWLKSHNVPECLQFVIQNCLQMDPKDRVTASQLLSHRYVLPSGS
jgi:serine/threonine protein kinase